MVAVEEIKSVNLINYNQILSNDLIGAIGFKPQNAAYKILHNTYFKLCDRLNTETKPVTAYVLEVYPFLFTDWHEMLDKKLTLNLLHIDQINELLKTGSANFNKVYDENSITITMREVCGYGDNAHNIINDKMNLFKQHPQFIFKEYAALFIYKKLK